MAASKTVQSFLERLEDMLDALHEVFPDCKKVEKVLTDFRTMIKPNPGMHTFAIQGWHAEVSPYYEPIRRRDIDTLLHAEISMFRKVDIAGKWQDAKFNDESRQILFEYLDDLNKHACLYCALPQNMMSKIEETAGNLISKFETGEMKPEDMNFQQISQSILGDMTEQDKQDFMQNMPQMQNTMMMLLGGGGSGGGGGQAQLFSMLLGGGGGGNAKLQ